MAFRFEDDPVVAKKNAKISFALLLTGAVMGILSLRHVVPFGQGFEMVALATNLANNGAFANPFYLVDTGPSAANPPLYPLFLALVMKVLKGPLVVWAATLGNIYANALAAAWLPRVSWLFYCDTVPGVIAGIIWVLAVRLMPIWDVSYTVAALLLFCLLSAASVGKHKNLIPGLAGGLLAGALFLLNPSTILVLIPWCGYLLIFPKARSKQIARYLSVVFAVLALVIFAWTYRNHKQLGKFVVRTNLGLTLYSSNNDCASPSLYEEEISGCYLALHPNTSLQEAQLVRSLGEVEYDRRRISDTKAWIHNHPKAFERLSAARFRDFWFPPLTGFPFKSAIIRLATLLSIPGIILMARRREPLTLFILCVCVVYPILYYIVVSDVRYRYPILWVSLLPCGYFLQWIVQRFRRRVPTHVFVSC